MEERGNHILSQVQDLPLPPACPTWKHTTPIFSHQKTPWMTSQSLQLLSLLFLPQLFAFYIFYLKICRIQMIRAFPQLHKKIHQISNLRNRKQSHVKYNGHWYFLGRQFKGPAQHNPGTRTESSCYATYESCPYFLGYLRKVLPSLLWHHSHAISAFTEQKHCPVLCKSGEGQLDFKHLGKGTTVKWNSLQWPNSRKLCQVIIFLTLSVSFPEVHKCSKQF